MTEQYRDPGRLEVASGGFPDRQDGIRQRFVFDDSSRASVNLADIILGVALNFVYLIGVPVGVLISLSGLLVRNKSVKQEISYGVDVV